ncbi:MAG: AbrB/MazE/SpoVT family DNA-binding domain-containing protein [Nanoarchaeota archaeon]|nr:AbrB/MazE/SpoVT family DNA-binding domain-containing protein [Nanoarchaeota archaeon]
MEILKMSSRGQVVIPQQLRNELDLEEGTLIGIEKVNDIAVIKKIDSDLVNQFKRSLEDLKAGRVKRVA